MYQINDAKQVLKPGKDRWEQELNDGILNRGLGDALVEAMEAQDHEVDLLHLRRRRRARTVAAGAIAGMMAARRAVQQISNMGTHDFTH